ncbi:cysteine proteinase inhibitor 1-like [Rhodamnia argentea]|uniref:Cysteine proteinase inhibitor 1-like n=1 Tax=Rhodamnia argentea TaxID=178133 RepID=A0A8B8R0L9_9MYRT|nr:cysteine proteinase inhibitor 1-like [Rhodamnia argentea]XP_048132113.1 cysteine proteinase inhibitor 1-like [Rhodamnia argentea]XP_048132114.1 cysteine proteinase inhibitor 1-like [Rhodamnia argentea]
MRLLILAATAVAVLLLEVSAAGAARTGPPLGGWQPIKNLSDPYVREIAEFAVKTHNVEANTGLLLKKVVKGETQVVAGTNYKLVVEVKDGADAKRFEALVWDKPWEHFRRLSSFKAVQGNV